MSILMNTGWMRRAASSGGRALMRPLARIVARRLEAVVAQANAADVENPCRTARRSRAINPDNFR